MTAHSSILLQDPKLAPPTLRSEFQRDTTDAEWSQLKEKILSDFGNRMTPEFLVPEDLKERTLFWFDVYARYGEAHHIIHHVRYPWVVFKVVDTTAILNSGKGPLWLRRDRAQKLAKKEAQAVRESLRRLARRKNFHALNASERDLLDKLSILPGPRHKVLKMAAENVRSQLGQRDFFQRGLTVSSRYLPYMEEEFRRLGTATEITRLPFVESSFNEAAYSKVGASGIWQIMPRTGKAYMIVNDHIDERNSPLKATAAAGSLLRSYFRALGSWPLALTAYNHGIGNIQKAIQKARSRDLAEIIARYHQGDFRFASSNFFTCFLAALYAEKYHELLFKDVPRDPFQEREVIRLGGTTARGT
ncbi:MAG: lytic transglycosylase domain-containing protein [Calothrix sp. SM1_5_4]|nr:lytic transglycosylase domain-containing protein [Calothrix sp. SM1_5_4]